MRVIIVSNQPLCRDALGDVVKAHLPVAEILKVSQPNDVTDPPGPFDLSLLDLPAGAEPGPWLAAASPRLGGGMKALIVPQNELSLALVAHAHGFRGLISKNSETALIGAALQLICAGGEYFPCFADAARASPTSGPKPGAKTLSPRQSRVLELLGLGRTNKEIARELGISVATVKLDVQAILVVTQARNRTEAVSRIVSDYG